jgi:hypothetical protein
MPYELRFDVWAEGDSQSARSILFSIDTLLEEHDLAIDGTADTVVRTFTASAGGPFTLTFTGGEGPGQLDMVWLDNVSLTVVPEPGSLTLLLAVSAGLALLRRRRRSL